MSETVEYQKFFEDLEKTADYHYQFIKTLYEDEIGKHDAKLEAAARLVEAVDSFLAASKPMAIVDMQPLADALAACKEAGLAPEGGGRGEKM